MKIHTIGDPHLGRKFVRGVPLHNRGKREEQQWVELRKKLDEECDVNVTMGDLFDGFEMPAEIILDAAWAYRAASLKHPETQFVVLMGNHDGVRDADRRSAFDLFRGLLEHVKNIVCVRSKPHIYKDLLFLPWDPFVSAEEMLEGVTGEFTYAFGHWDVIAFESNKHNLIPVSSLKKLGVKAAATGHDHTKRDITIDDLKVCVTGSMIPFAFDQDPDETIYVTRTLEQVLADPDAYKDKAVRVLLEPGEEMPEIDCLQLVEKRITAEQKEQIKLDDVQIEQFNFLDLFKETFANHGVSDEVTTEFLEIYDREKVE